MNKTQKIIILLSSLLCGSPIIFLAFRDHHQEKKKNNLQQEIKKRRKKKKSNPIAISKSSSFLFWIVIITVMIVLVIIAIIYKKKKKKKNNPDNFIDDEDSSNGSLFQKTAKKQKNETEKQLNPLEEKKSLKCGFFTDQYGIHITFFKDPSQQINMAINNISAMDIVDIRKIQSFGSPNFFKNINANNSLSNTLQTVLGALANFLSTYLTSQLLMDVYQEVQTSNKDYGILKTMAIKFVTSKDQFITIYSELLTPSNLQKENQQQIDSNMLKHVINQNQPLELFRIVMNNQQLTFIDVAVNARTFLFLRTFKLCKFVEIFYQNYLFPFMSAHPDRYKKPLQTIKHDMENINNLYNHFIP